MDIDQASFIQKASALVNPITLSCDDMSAATVGCVLLAANGKEYEGVCIDLSCGLGFCAEASAIANMLKDGETQIVAIVAVGRKGCVLSPCGRCREMMAQVDKRNFDAQVILSAERSVALKALLPDHWLHG